VYIDRALFKMQTIFGLLFYERTPRHEQLLRVRCTTEIYQIV